MGQSTESGAATTIEGAREVGLPRWGALPRHLRTSWKFCGVRRNGRRGRWVQTCHPADDSRYSMNMAKGADPRSVGAGKSNTVATETDLDGGWDDEPAPVALTTQKAPSVAPKSVVLTTPKAPSV